MVFAVLLGGVISATIYNWLTEFDSFTSYAFLPVEVSEVIDAKLKSYALANLLPATVLVLAAATSGGGGGRSSRPLPRSPRSRPTPSR
ncbi:hypothetical protein [Methanoculleus chikugoensis]|uniref:hypothetical protein n=1 Tax=Methanoculleus chikugoensis TaxID=118126 RepID=UPI0006D23585|nr:hypothetical protein [Methanoculleus chikugoensis]